MDQADRMRSIVEAIAAGHGDRAVATLNRLGWVERRLFIAALRLAVAFLQVQVAVDRWRGRSGPVS